jgi:hypothetical protein
VEMMKFGELSEERIEEEEGIEEMKEKICHSSGVERAGRCE